MPALETLKGNPAPLIHPALDCFLCPALRAGGVYLQSQHKRDRPRLLFNDINQGYHCVLNTLDVHDCASISENSVYGILSTRTSALMSAPPQTSAPRQGT